MNEIFERICHEVDMTILTGEVETIGIIKIKATISSSFKKIKPS